MNTLAVMCIALTRHSPSRTPLRCTAASTSGVIFTKSIRAGMLNFNSSRWDFIARLYGGILMNRAAYNTANETMAPTRGCSIHADALCVHRVGSVPPAAASAANRAANDEQRPQYLCALERSECGQRLYE